MFCLTRLYTHSPSESDKDAQFINEKTSLFTWVKPETSQP